MATKCECNVASGAAARYKAAALPLRLGYFLAWSVFGAAPIWILCVEGGIVRREPLLDTATSPVACTIS